MQSRTGAADASFAALDRRLDEAIAERTFPGVAVAFGAVGHPPIVRCRGRIGYEADAPPVRRSTRYDLASMSKPVATAMLVLRRVVEGRFDLDEPLEASLRSFGRAGKGSITWRHALLHAAGLAPTPSLDRARGRSRAELVELILAQSAVRAPGIRSEYSCDGYIVMGLALEAQAGRTLAELWRDERRSLGLARTGYLPSAEFGPDDIAPTEVRHPIDGIPCAGEVDDPLCRALGGVAGNAGIFASVDDMVALARTWLGDPTVPGTLRIPRALIEAATRPADPARTGSRALVWDTRSETGYTVAGTTLGARSFGHTGNTGTSMWMDPDLGFYVVLMSNAVHPVRDARRGYVWLRPQVTDLAFHAWRASVTPTGAVDSPAPPPPGGR